MPTSNPPRKRRRKGKIIALALLGVLLADIAWVQWDRRITVGHDTTRITGPFVDGYPDYLAALNLRHSQGVTIDNNAAVQLAGILGMDDVPEARRREACIQMHMPDAWVVAGPHFQDFTAWMTEHGPVPQTAPEHPWESPYEREFTEAALGPWKAADHARMARWLGEMTPLMDTAEKASRRTRFYYPLMLEDGRVSAAAEAGLLLTNDLLGPLRALSRAVAARAMLRLQDGDLAGVQQDILLDMRLARLLVQQPTLIEYLVALAIDDLAMHAAQAAAAGPLTAEAAEDLRRQMEALPPLPSPGRAIDEAERYMSLSATCGLHQATGKNGPLNLIPMNFDAALRRVNVLLDRTVQVCDLPTEPQRRAALEDLSREVDAQYTHAGTVHRILHLEDLFVAIVFPSLTNVHKLQTANLVDRDLALTALALRQTRATGGAFPISLNDFQSAGFQVPLDRFTEKPLCYRRVGEGYVLYSVGADLADNGGEPRSEDASRKQWDIVVRADR